MLTESATVRAWGDSQRMLEDIWPGRPGLYARTGIVLCAEDVYVKLGPAAVKTFLDSCISCLTLGCGVE